MEQPLQGTCADHEKGAQGVNQCSMILEHLREHGSITPLEALNQYGIMRLASRINDLKKHGADIRKENIYYLRDGAKKHYAKYFLVEDMNHEP